MTDPLHNAAGTLDDAEAPDTSPGEPSPLVGDSGGPAIDFAALRAGGRGPDGKFQRGHLVNVRHGLRVRPDHPDVAALVDERFEGLLAHLGGDATAVERPLALQLAHAQVIAESQARALVRDGLETVRGNSSARFARWDKVTDKLMKLSAMLGMQRRGREIKDLAADFEAQGRE